MAGSKVSKVGSNIWLYFVKQEVPDLPEDQETGEFSSNLFLNPIDSMIFFLLSSNPDRMSCIAFTEHLA